ncbi:MAG: hypothetical protein KKD18_03370 [Nanoarchaeota archaeon]|nr:hypothetical protein [Nanoarchaeota archaeon]MBU0977430.1 hypothetical protein [Nanoarchaeota archaeon]
MMNKRGIFFLMLTLIIISLFMLSITFFSDMALWQSVQKRVKTLNSFVSFTEEDLSRQIFITGYRAIFYMEKEIVDTGDYLNDTDALMNEIFFNGTINGRSEPLLQAITFSKLEQLISERAAAISATSDFSNPSINITQEDSWNVKVIFTVDFFLEDRNGLASWNKTLVTETLIAISNFTDPVYFVETAGNTEPPTFTRTPYSGFDSSNLSAHITGRYYREHSDAPSFLDRLEGNLLATSPYGIESLVYVNDIPVPYRTGKSLEDHVYFSSASLSGTCHLAGMDPWVRLDNIHRAYYGDLAC